MKILEKARLENAFHCADGAVLGSVYELENKLCTMSREVFHHHSNQTRNDFHNWARDVFHDYDLANDLLVAKTPAEAAAIVRKHLRKALLAKEEIEDAIQAVAIARTKSAKPAAKNKPAKAVPKKLFHTLKPQKRRKRRQKKARKTIAVIKLATPKNRKLNKKRSTRQNSRAAAKKHNRSSLNKKRGKAAHKRAKKKVNKWLNWLKIVPEL